MANDSPSTRVKDRDHAPLSSKPLASSLIVAVTSDWVDHRTTPVSCCASPLGLRKRLSVSSSASMRSEEHTSELQSLMRISYAVFCLKKKTKIYNLTPSILHTYT